MRNIKLLAVVALAALLGVISCSKEDAVTSEADENSTARVSETSVVGTPPTFDLDIIGVPQNFQGPWPDMTNKIFVPLGGRPKLLLGKADPDSYQITDWLATDGSASFVLPSSDKDHDGTSAYTVWAKLVGSKGGIFICGGDNTATETTDWFYEVCSAGELTFRVGGNVRYANVSGQLLYITVPRGKTINLEGPYGNFTLTSGKYPVFDDRFRGHYWEYYGSEAEGLRIVKLGFKGQ